MSGPRKVSDAVAKRAVPILLTVFVLSLVIDNAFKYVNQPIADSLGISLNTAGLQATIPGILIGIGAVVYSALSDAVSIRKLMIIAVILIAIGSVVGFAFQGSWPIVLTARIIQTTGLAAAETLYVVFVTKHFKGDSQKTYLGFSTAAFQFSLLLGVVGGGFVATYISWPVLFLIALAPLLALPVIIKTVPEEETAGSSLDVFGLFLVDAGNWVYILSMTIFPAGFALMYAPLVSTAVRRIPAENSGIAIGFYNLTINMAIPIGIAYSLNLISQDLQFMSAFASPEGTPFASVLLILGVIAAAAFVLYLAVAKILHADDPADAPPVNIH